MQGVPCRPLCYPNHTKIKHSQNFVFNYERICPRQGKQATSHESIQNLLGGKYAPWEIVNGFQIIGQIIDMGGQNYTFFQGEGGFRRCRRVRGLRNVFESGKGGTEIYREKREVNMKNYIIINKHTEKSCISSYYSQFSINTKIKIIKLILVRCLVFFV